MSPDHPVTPPNIGTFLRSSRLRRILQVAGGVLLALLLVLVGIALTVRFAVLPGISQYRGDIADMIGRQLHMRVELAGVDAQWSGLHPELALQGLTLHDPEGRPALSLERVEAELSWTSLLTLRPEFRRLEIVAPQLAMRREENGHIFVAGLQVNTEGEGGDFADWLLSQHQIRVRDARLEWRDALRGAAPLVLEGVNFRLENRGARHRFGLTARPPADLAATLDVRGDLHGRDPDALASWHGELYAALDYANLGAWRAWVDYPVEADGAGGLRAWMEFGGGKATSVTADVALRDARVKLRKDLEAIELAHAEGRVQWRQVDNGFAAGTKGLALVTRAGERVAPTDFSLRWQPADGHKPAKGELNANHLDLAVLASLAGRLPLEDSLREKLAALAPRGQVAPLDLRWTGEADRIETYAVNAGFQDLSLAASGNWPGFGGLSGRVEGNDRGGRFTLDSKAATLDLPTIFPVPTLPLDRLAAEGTWSQRDGALEVVLNTATFANRDATGTASGRYKTKAQSLGEIDLQARLTDADGQAVWRYMPLVVNQDVRTWLQRSLLGGRAHDAHLQLKGDLSKFPFRDSREGLFRVTARIADARLDYAPGWPSIERIQGELAFEGQRMQIRAREAWIHGVQLHGVLAEIADLEDHEELMTIRGKATGPTQDFLRFVGESPVAERIDRFTDPFRTEGNGTLDLLLTMPLRHIADTRVKGDYRFAANRLSIDPALPPLTEASGQLGFTEASLSLNNGNAKLLGQPLTASGSTRPDGTVFITGQGGATALGLRKELDHPALDHLSGSTSWRGTVMVKKKGVEVMVDSSLAGMASSLPQPFNKSAAASLPLHFELATGEGKRDVLRMTVGPAFKLQLNRRREGERMVVERGGIALGEQLKVPDRGVLLAVNMPSLDVDAWRKAFGGDQGGGKGGSGRTALPLSGVALHAGELKAYGQQFSDVNLRAVMEEGGWQARLSSKEMTGDFLWRDQGRGRLQARFRQLALNGGGDGDGAAGSQPEEKPLKELPGLDVVADSFILRGKPLGRLELRADNRGGDAWTLERLSIVNPDGSLSGDGLWRPGPRQETRLNFQLVTSNIGKLLERLGYPDAVRRGQATLEGNISWAGTPLALHYPSLDGQMRVEAEAGQFNRLEPGVGRLLGVLSLQTLPRRITLDFRDVFSEGFAFDRISGSIQVTRGVLRTKDLEIRGPAARVFMQGEADVASETQNLRVRVQPTLSESVAVGTALATATTGLLNPVAGVAAYLAQKVLRDPVEKVFSFEYAITGRWADPKVAKLARTGPAAN